VRRTLGGMRVERPRTWVKLILSAAGQLASIGFLRAVRSDRATHLGWQDAAVEMEGRAGVMEVVENESCD
jgi:hypothetical protein